MWAICKKELRQFFSSLTGYIAIAIFLVANGLVHFALRNNILETGYATLEPFFAFAPWVLLFLVPAITMRSFSDEFKSGTWELLQTRPLTTGQLVGGKFLGAFLVAAIALVPTLVYYFVINHLAAGTGIDSGAAAGSYLGLLLLAAVFTAIGICVSSFTTNPVVAFIISVVACLLFYYGFAALAEVAAAQNGADYYMSMAGIDFHYQSISKGVADTRDLLYFISLTAAFLLITALHLSARNSRKRKSGYLRYAGIAAALLIINFIGTRLHGRYDLTADKRYSLTAATKQSVQSLATDVRMDVFLKGELPAGFRRLGNATTDFIANLKDLNPGRVSYRVLSPEEDAGNGKPWADSLLAMGVQPINLSVQVKAGEENKNIYPYALLTANGQTEVVNLFANSKRSISEAELANAEAMMEYQFADGLDKLTNGQTTSVLYATGNGEPQGPETFDLQQVIGSRYRLNTFNLSAHAFIPKQASVLMVVKPATPFSEADKLKIDQYVAGGGKLLLFMDNLFAEPDSLRLKSELVAYDRGLNLADLLFNYGVRVNGDLLMDLQCDYQPFGVGGTPEAPQFEFIKWNYYPLFESRGNHPINKNLGLVSGHFVNTLDTVEAPGISKTYLLQSSANSRSISTPTLISPNQNRNAPEDAQFRRAGLPVAVLLQGRFTSLYNNRVSKAQMDSLAPAGGFVAQSAEPNKIILVADGDVVLNDVSEKKGPLPMGMNLFTLGSQYEYQFANREFLLNCLEYLASNSNIIATRNKEIVLRLLDPKKTAAEQSRWQVITIGLPVVLVLLAGGAYQALRRRRYAV